MSNTLISLSVYWLCFYLLHMQYQLSNLLAFVVSVTNAYFWNSKYVFKSKEKREGKECIKTYGRTFLSYGSTYILSALLLYLWVERLHISEGLAPMINLLVTIPLNFFLNKKWVFR